MRFNCFQLCVVLIVIYTVQLLICYTNFLLDADWEKRWISSTKKGSDAGKFVLSAGKFYNDPEQDKGTKL